MRISADAAAVARLEAIAGGQKVGTATKKTTMEDIEICDPHLHFWDATVCGPSSVVIHGVLALTWACVMSARSAKPT